MKNILIVSDTHCNHEQLYIPDNIDMIIHCGDSTNSKGSYNHNEAIEFLGWYNNLGVRNKILIAGNHDYTLFSNKSILDDYKNITYLEMSATKYTGLRIYGTPYTPKFGSWYFMLSTQEQIQLHASSIPPCDILVTHGPPMGILDSAYEYNDREGKRLFHHCGDDLLRQRVNKIKPKLHVFGHIHNGDKYPTNNGVYFNGDTYFINASCCKDGNMGKVQTHGWIVQMEGKDIVSINKNKIV